MGRRIITISRQFGSGGVPIAKQLSERLSIPYYDQDILSELASRTGYKPEIIEYQGNYLKHSGWLYGLTNRNRFEQLPQDLIWDATVQLIKGIADKGPCIIVGRCADYILRNDYDILPVFIHADIDSRMRRAVAEYGIKADGLEKLLRDKDHMRSTYYQFYTNITWGDSKNYTICLNSGDIGIEKCVDIITELY